MICDEMDALDRIQARNADSRIFAKRYVGEIVECKYRFVVRYPDDAQQQLWALWRAQRGYRLRYGYSHILRALADASCAFVSVREAGQLVAWFRGVA